MRRRTIIIAMAAAGLAAGGTALASPGGPLRDDSRTHQAELAKDLAAHLDGVTATEIQQALEKVRQERATEHRTELARELASRLDGETVADVEAALEKAQQRAGTHSRPGPGGHDALIQTLADELDRSEADVREALAAAMRARREARLDEAVKAGKLTRAQADRIRERIAQGGRHDRFEQGPGAGGPAPTMEPAPF